MEKSSTQKSAPRKFQFVNRGPGATVKAAVLAENGGFCFACYGGAMLGQKSKDFPDSFHRVSIKGLYVRDGKVLLCHDFVFREPAWELPGGGLDFGETFSEGLQREIREEMSLEVTHVAEKPSYLWTVRRENARGMGWWYALLIAYRIDIKTLDALVPTDECREVRFFSKEEMLQMPNLSVQIKQFAELFNPADFS